MPDFNGGTIGGNMLPDVTGRDLGSATQLWDLYVQNIFMAGAMGTAGQSLVMNPGATTQIWQSKPVFDTRDYGSIAATIAALPATGGVVDDRASQGAQTIASTITVSATKPVTILLGAATYSCGTGTAFAVTGGTNAHFNLIGLGKDVTTIKASGTNAGPMVHVSDLTNAGPDGSLSWGTVSDLTIDGNNTAAGLLIDWAAMGCIQNVHYVNCLGYSQKHNKGWDNLSINNWYDLMPASSGGVSIHLNDASQNRIIGNLFSPSLTMGILFNDSTGGVFVAGNEFQNVTTGISIPKAATSATSGVDLINNFYENCSVAALVIGGGAGTLAPYNIRVAGGGFALTGGSDVTVSDGDHITFDSCVLSNATYGANVTNLHLRNNKYLGTKTLNTTNVFDCDLVDPTYLGGGASFRSYGVGSYGATNTEYFSIHHNGGAGDGKVHLDVVKDGSGNLRPITLNMGATEWLSVTNAGVPALPQGLGSYKGIATVSGGVPAEYATVDLTAQTAAITTTTLYAVTAAGQFRLTWNAKVTTPATTGAGTSTLGALTIVYTDPDGVNQTITAPATIAAGTLATTSAANTTAAVLLGLPLTLNCKASTNITYAMAYASDTAAQMAYNLHIKLEAL